MRAGALSIAIFVLACQSDPTGIRVDIDMTSQFSASVKALRLTVDLVGGGFKGGASPVLRDGVTITYPAAGGLVMDLRSTEQHPFAQKMAFRLETGNGARLTFNAKLSGFDAAGKLIASDHHENVALPANAEASLAFMLMMDSDDTTIDTTVVDLAKENVDAMVTAAASDAAMTTVAVCNLDGDGGDLVIGVPTATAPGNVTAGAVYIVFDGARNADLANLNGAPEMHFYGVNGGDRLGASIACLNFDGDLTDDLVVGAPGAYGDGATPPAGAGRVYVIKGRRDLRNTNINLSQHQADIEWIGAGATAGLGEHVLAATMQKNHPAVLLAAPGEGSGVVHLMSGIAFTAAAATPRVLGGTAGHVTFSGIKPAAMAVGDLDGNGAPEGGSDVMLGDPGFVSVVAPVGTVGAVHIFRDVDPAGATAFSVGGSGTLGPARTLLGSADKQAFGAALLAVELSSLGTDLVVGAPGDNSGTGAALVFKHDAVLVSGVLAPQPLWTFNGAAAGERLGATLASGKIGVADGAPLVFGAPDAAGSGGSAAGAVYSYKRSAVGDRPTLAQRFLGKTAGDRLGSAIAVGPIGPGTNGPGTKVIADLVMLAPGFAAGTSSAPGVAYVRLTK